MYEEINVIGWDSTSPKTCIILYFVTKCLCLKHLCAKYLCFFNVLSSTDKESIRATSIPRDTTRDEPEPMETNTLHNGPDKENAPLPQQHNLTANGLPIPSSTQPTMLCLPIKVPELPIKVPELRPEMSAHRETMQVTLPTRQNQVTQPPTHARGSQIVIPRSAGKPMNCVSEEEQIQEYLNRSDTAVIYPEPVSDHDGDEADDEKDDPNKMDPNYGRLNFSN